MPTEQNVNRIYDPSLEAELREAGLDQAEPQTADSIRRSATGRIEIPPAFPFPPPTQADLITQELKEAGIEVDTEESVAPEFRLKKMEVLETPYNETAEAISKVLKTIAPRDPDLREFKKQVINAFKHLGLDTQKFFGV